MSNTNDTLDLDAGRVRAARGHLGAGARRADSRSRPRRSSRRVALAPLFATGRGSRAPAPGPVQRQRSRRSPSRSVLPFIPVKGGFDTFWSQTIGFQFTRESPFSIWGQNPGFDGAADVRRSSPRSALAVAVAFVPRRRTTAQVAALGAAVLIATPGDRDPLVLPLHRLVRAVRARRALLRVPHGPRPRDPARSRRPSRSRRSARAPARARGRGLGSAPGAARGYEIRGAQMRDELRQ